MKRIKKEMKKVQKLQKYKNDLLRKNEEDKKEEMKKVQKWFLYTSEFFSETNLKTFLI